jgi:glycosyltransferase involved in cell wall biosynthesis
MWGGKRVSLILPTFNEKDSIRRVIEEFRRVG